MEGDDLEIKQIKLAVRVDSIESLQKDNDKFKEDMAAHIKDSDALWNEDSGVQTPWEQIITWAMIGLSLLLGLTVASWTVKLQIQMWKSGKAANGSKLDELQREVNTLKPRMMDLETDVQLAENNTRRPPAYNTHEKS